MAQCLFDLQASAALHVLKRRYAVLRRAFLEGAADAGEDRDGVVLGAERNLRRRYLRHTSASLLIQENFDTDVMRDLEDFFAAQAPEDTTLYRHNAEGADDMPAHIKSALTQTHLAIPVHDGELLIGRYQGIFLFEHRRTPRPREIVLHFEGQ